MTLWARGNPNVANDANEPAGVLLLFRSFGRSLFRLLGTGDATEFFQFPRRKNSRSRGRLDGS